MLEDLEVQGPMFDMGLFYNLHPICSLNCCHKMAYNWMTGDSSYFSHHQGPTMGFDASNSGGEILAGLSTTSSVTDPSSASNSLGGASNSGLSTTTSVPEDLDPSSASNSLGPTMGSDASNSGGEILAGLSTTSSVTDPISASNSLGGASNSGLSTTSSVPEDHLRLLKTIAREFVFEKYRTAEKEDNKKKREALAQKRAEEQKKKQNKGKKK